MAGNRKPKAIADFLSGIEDVVLTRNLLANDTDQDGDALSVTSTGSWTTALGGRVTLNAGGTFAYDPRTAFQYLRVGQSVVDTITYTITDGTATDSNTVQVTINGVNDAPIAVSDTFNRTEDSITGNVLTNDTDVENDALSVTNAGTITSANGYAITMGANGAFSYNANTFQYLRAGQTILDSFTYNISDGQGGTATATANVTITGINDAPKVVNEASSAVEDGAPVSGNVLTNDSDVEGDLISVANAGTWTTARGATVTIGADGAYSYAVGSAFQSLGAGATTTDAITYTVSDGQGGSTNGTLTVTVTGVNDGPVAAADALTVTEDATAATGNVLSNDTDVDFGDVLTVTTTGTFATSNGGTVTLYANGAYSYAANPARQSMRAGETLSDSFNYTISDGKGGTSSNTVAITITGVNDAPTVVNEAASATEDGAAVTGNVLANDSDIEGDALTVGSAGSWTTAKGATITIGADGAYSYAVGSAFQTLGAGVTTTDAIVYTVSDGQGGSRNGTLTLTVLGVNDGPVAVADARSATEDTAVSGNVLTNDYDVDIGDALTVTTVGTWTTVGGGTVTMSSNGTYSYNPGAAFQSLGAGQTATDSFNYAISDGKGGAAASTVTITVAGVNDAPTAVGDTAAAFEDGAPVTGNLLTNDSDLEGDALSIATTGSFTTGRGATITIGANGAYTYNVGTAFQSLGLGDPITDTINYTVSDGKGGTASASLVIAVTGTNDAPVANADSNTTTEDAAATGNVLANDTDIDIGDVRTVTSTGSWTTTGGASVTMAADGNYTYTPGPAFQYLLGGQSATDSFTYTVSDGKGGAATGTVTVTITGRNEAPVANVDNATATEDGAAVSGNLLANDTDYEGNALTVTTTGSWTTANGATITVNADGSYVYAPGGAFQSLAAGQTAVDTITYGVSDGMGGNSTGTLRVTVTGTNDAPVANGETITGTEDGVLTGSLTANDTDVDGDLLTIANPGTQTTANGVFTVMWNGGYTYTPSAAAQALRAGQTATDTFTYTVADGRGGTSTATATIVITGVNDGPVARADNFSTVSNTQVTGNLLANDTDAEGDAVAVTSTGTRATTGGSVTMNADGTFVYTPNLAFSGSDTFSYSVSDGQGGTATSSVTILVSRYGTGPQAVGDSAVTTEDSGVTGNVLSNDSDAEGDPLTVTSVGTQTTAGGGSVTIAADGSYSYNPGTSYQSLKAGQTGTDSFTYTVTDGVNGSATATVSVTITGVNDAPVAAADSFAGFEDGTIAGNVLANDRDAEGDALTTVAGQIVSARGVAFNIDANGNFIYTPTANFSGTDSFTYTVRDASGATSSATVALSIAGVADAPNLTARDVTGQGNIPLDIAASLNDLDGSETLSIIISGLEAGSRLSAGTDLGGGRWQLTPNLLPGLTLTPTFGSTAPRTLTVTATSTDFGGSTAYRSATFTMTNTADGGASNGDDILTGTPGDDTLSGLAGNDFLIGLAGNDTLDGGLGNDTADYRDAAAAVNAKLGDSATGAAGSATGGAGSDTLISIENIIGSRFNDTLTGNAEANKLSGGAGADTIYGNAGDDIIDGGAGNDNLNGGTGYDTVLYDWAPSRVTVDLETGQASGGGGTDVLSGMDNVVGSAFNDVLYGHSGRNVIDGRAGDDVLGGRAGQNFLTGGVGADRFVFSGTSRMDTVTDFNRGEGDILDFRADFATYDAFLAAVTVTVTAGTTEIEYNNHAAHLTLTGVTSPIDRTWFIGW